MVRCTRASSERTAAVGYEKSHAAAGSVQQPGAKGRGNVKYHGDASIAARHLHVKPAHPLNASHGKSSAAPGRAKPHANVKPAHPGPYDAGPPPAKHKGGRGSGGHGKGK